MKKILLFVVAIMLSATCAFAQKVQDVVYQKNGSVIRGTITELKPSESVAIQTADGSIFVYKIDEVERTAVEDAFVPASSVTPLKSPPLAGILSFLVPGAGQFYYGNDKQGWIDLSETIVTGVTMWGCQQYVANTKSESGASTAALIYLTAGVWYVVNDICSVIDALKGTRAVNRENGYAMIDVGNGVSVGCRPSLSYEVPEYSCHMPGGVSTGMSFRIAF